MQGSKTKVLVSYDYFYPAFMAGGPIQSLVNMVRALHTKFDFYVVAGNKDLGSNEPLLGVPANTWVDFENGVAKVIYLDQNNRGFSRMKELLKEIKPNVVFLNGVYSLPFAFYLGYKNSCRTILHARGMFHPEALNQKRWKKKIYLSVLKGLGFFTNLEICVSDAKERGYVESLFRNIQKFWAVPNLPNFQMNQFPLDKVSGSLRMITVALISPMKNHLKVMKALKGIDLDIRWDIYGPVKDADYWELCMQEMEQTGMHAVVNYCGVLNPECVNETVAKYHVMVQPSESENFGHSLIQCLFQGRPLITSKHTPWNQLEESMAGINVELNVSDLQKAIEMFSQLNQEDYEKWVTGSRAYAARSIQANKILEEYETMFNKNN